MDEQHIRGLSPSTTIPYTPQAHPPAAAPHGSTKWTGYDSWAVLVIFVVIDHEILSMVIRIVPNHGMFRHN